ncbi:hypothetical protein WMY93_020085 [Mugilogobius chulae]|uniref:L1 transposable element RRM domain-containing protein n=1 Tax=Mugilogobius chulae TaxID=88201 RepID=A0AAW0NR22_9GOBI
MSTRHNPSPEDDSVAQPAQPASATAESPDKLDKLFDEISHMNETLRNVATDVSTIKGAMAEMTTTVCAMQGRLDEAEARITHLEETSEQLLNDETRKSKDVEALWNRLQALENQSRRHNVRLVGLRESFGTNGTLLECVRKIFSEGLGVEADGMMEIERVHRQLKPMPNPDQPPRQVLIRFLRQSARDKAVNLAKEKRGFQWEGCRMSLFPDMSKEVADKRKAFTAVKRKLRELDVRYSLAFPATLHFKWKGKSVNFTTATAAEKFIADHE